MITTTKQFGQSLVLHKNSTTSSFTTVLLFGKFSVISASYGFSAFAATAALKTGKKLVSRGLKENSPSCS